MTEETNTAKMEMASDLLDSVANTDIDFDDLAPELRPLIRQAVTQAVQSAKAKKHAAIQRGLMEQYETTKPPRTASFEEKQKHRETWRRRGLELFTRVAYDE